MKSKSQSFIQGLIPEVIPLKLFLDHFRLQKSQKDLEIANHVTWIYSRGQPKRKHPRNARGNITAGGLGTMSKRDSRGISSRITPILRLNLISFSLSCFKTKENLYKRSYDKLKFV